MDRNNSKAFVSSYIYQNIVENVERQLSDSKVLEGMIQ